MINATFIVLSGVWLFRIILLAWYFSLPHKRLFLDLNLLFFTRALTLGNNHSYTRRIAWFVWSNLNSVATSQFWWIILLPGLLSLLVMSLNREGVPSLNKLKIKEKTSRFVKFIVFMIFYITIYWKKGKSSLVSLLEKDRNLKITQLILYVSGIKT